MKEMPIDSGRLSEEQGRRSEFMSLIGTSEEPRPRYFFERIKGSGEQPIGLEAKRALRIALSLSYYIPT